MSAALRLVLDPVGERVQTRSRTIPCAGCGQPFEPVRPHQKHCRPSCRMLAFKSRQTVLLLDYVEPDPGRPD